MESVDKPGSVVDGHLSGMHVAAHLLRPLPGESADSFILSLFGLAPDGVCQASASLRSWWSLTPPFQLCSDPPKLGRGPILIPIPEDRSVFFSVALSVGSLPLAVNEHRVLRSPDFPPRPSGRSDHLTYSSSIIPYRRHGSRPNIKPRAVPGRSRGYTPVGACASSLMKGRRSS